MIRRQRSSRKLQSDFKRAGYGQRAGGCSLSVLMRSSPLKKTSESHRPWMSPYTHAISFSVIYQCLERSTFLFNCTTLPQTESQKVFTFYWYFTLPKNNQQKMQFSSSMKQLELIRFRARVPKISPPICPGEFVNLTTCFDRSSQSKEIFAQPLLLPVAVFIPNDTSASKLPQSVKPLPLTKAALMGGWWLICQPQKRVPSIIFWQVSPRIGLKGLSQRMQQAGQVSENLMTCLNRQRGGKRAAGYRMRGAKRNDPISKERLDSDENTWTGSEILSILCPDSNLLIMYLMTLLCASNLSQLLTTNSPSQLILNQPCIRQ